MGEPLFVGEPYVIDDGDTALFHNHLHGYLVHAVGRGECVATGIGYTDGFEYALEYAVLAVTAVQYGNDYVEFCPYIVPEKGSFLAVEVVVAVFGNHVNLGAHVLQGSHVAIVFYFEQGIAAEPTSLFGDVYGYDFVFLFIKSIDGLESRDNGDFVLGGAASEKNTYGSFHNFL